MPTTTQDQPQPPPQKRFWNKTVQQVLVTLLAAASIAFAANTWRSWGLPDRVKSVEGTVKSHETKTSVLEERIKNQWSEVQRQLKDIGDDVKGFNQKLDRLIENQ